MITCQLTFRLSFGAVRVVREILADLERWRARGEPVAVAAVLGVERSAPRPLGAMLAVSAAGEIAGSVSGGCVEGAVVQTAE